MIQLSIVIPIYNAELFIHSCIESIFMQGLNEEVFEVILVNDGTKDNSFIKISDLLNIHHNISIIEQSNQGPSIARNNGIEHAKGEYILMPDSDDIIIDKTLPILLNHAISSKADMVIGDFVKLANHTISGNTTFNSKSEYKSKSGIDFFIHDFNPKECFVWRTLYRREFLLQKNLRFIPGIYFEDIPFTVDCYLCAKKCDKVPLLFYIYRQRKDSIVTTINMKKLLDMNTSIAHLHNLKSKHNSAITKKIDDTIYSTFSIAIWYIAHNKKLFHQRKSYIEDIKGRIPNFRFTNGLKQRLISYFFHLAPNLYIRLCAFR